jgi:hypothetical protein
MDQPASFSSLPPELVAKICNDPDLDKEDLIALRLTSKTQGVHASATKTFAKRYFTDVLLLWSKYSLETFVKICQHPVFGSSIRKVQLSCARYEEAEFEDSVQELLGQNHERCELLRMIQQLGERCDHDHEQFDSERVEALLDQAFGHLAKLDNCFVLAVAADEENSLGRSKVLGPQMGSGGWWADPYSALEYLILAADRSSLEIRKIEVDVDAASECELDSHSFVFRAWKDLRSVRSISEPAIDLWVTPGLNRYRDFGMVQTLLSLPVHLKRLRICSNIFAEDDKFRPLAELISRLPLEELHLDSLHMDRDAMTDMLEGFGPTLRRLEISDCAITGSWMQILLSIQQHALQPGHLHIKDTARDWMGSSMVYNSVTDVRSGLIRLLQIREGMIQNGESELLSDKNDIQVIISMGRAQL